MSEATAGGRESPGHEPEIVFESLADQGGFTIFPNVVLLDATVSPKARLLYGLFQHFARQERACFPGQERLSVLLDATDRTVRTYIRELENALLVRTERRGLGKTNRYVLLALGLRTKRLADRDRKPVSDQGDRKPVSGQTGSQLPTTNTQKEEDADNGESARPRAVTVKFRGKPVKAEAWALTELVLAEYNQQTGRKWRLLTSGGQPSEAAKRIYGRVATYSDLKLEDHADIIRRTLASKWWGSESNPGIGVIYGEKVFEDNIDRPGVPKNAKDTEKRERAARDREAIERVMARARGEEVAA